MNQVFGVYVRTGGPTKKKRHMKLSTTISRRFLGSVWCPFVPRHESSAKPRLNLIAVCRVRPDIATYAVGMTASMGTVLRCAGTAGKRYCMPNATIHMHQPLGGAQGQATDIEIQAKQILRLKALLLGIMAKHTGQPLEVIERDSDRDYYLEARGAVDYGLIDQVLEAPEKVK